MISARSVGATLAVLACAGTLLAQSPAPAPSASPSAAPRAATPPPFRVEVDVDVVSVTAVVYDKAGRFVRGLGPKDIEVLEDGVPQEVSYFREAAGAGPERIPLSVGLQRLLCIRALRGRLEREVPDVCSCRVTRDVNPPGDPWPLGYLHMRFFAGSEGFADHAAFATSWSGFALRQASNA